ncbi:MAG: glutathione-disulfide reductase [Rubellimicrobium sp.]|nr:glutathione-disulfide reductase [Rubellimicrobium sp.]
MNEREFDLVVIGGGSGGVRAARVAAEAGARVALAEEDRMGGTCVIRGCVPKKLMVYASSFADLPAEARGYGWDFGVGRFDWGAFRTRLHGELARLESVYRRLLDGSGVTVFDARARVAGPGAVELAGGQVIRAREILIATGGRPERPEVPGADLCLVSDDVFDLTELPESLLVVGGGYIACEMASIMAGLGVEVTLMCRAGQVLRGFDDEAREVVAAGLRAQGIAIVPGTAPVGIARTGGVARTGGGAGGGALRVRDSAGAERVVAQVLLATGRRPNSAGLGLAEAGVRLGPGGAVVVDSHSRTSVPGIWAVGDVTGRVNLTPVAIREAMAFVETAFRGNPTQVDHELIASAVFTRPEFGTVGLTEEEARATGPVEIYATSFKPMRSGFAGGEAKVHMKLVVSATTRRVLGCHIVAPEAGEMIQLAAIAVKMGATKEDFDRTCAVHPTMAEELVTMRRPVRSWGIEAGA